MIKLADLLNEEQNIQELGAKDIALGAAMAASSIFGGAKAQSKIPTNQPAITQQVSNIKINPNFWVKDSNDVKKVQKAIKLYRAYTIGVWKLGINGAHKKGLAGIEIELGGRNMDPTKPEDVKKVESDYMKWCLGTKEDGKNGKYTSQFRFPKEFLENYNNGTLESKVDLGLEGNDILQQVKGELTTDKMISWNNFGTFMDVKGYSGKEDMNHASYRDYVLQQYKGQVKENKMTKQQLREAIRRIIKQELNEGMKTKDVPNPNKGKWRIVGLETGNVYPSQGDFYGTEKEAKAAARKLNLTKDSGVKIVQLKDTMQVFTKENYPAVADPETEEDVETTPYIAPDEDDDDLTIGNPNVKPNPKAEQDIIKKIMARYQSSLNEKKIRK